MHEQIEIEVQKAADLIVKLAVLLTDGVPNMDQWAEFGKIAMGSMNPAVELARLVENDKMTPLHIIAAALNKARNQIEGLELIPAPVEG